MSELTPEQIEAMRLEVQAYDAAQNEAGKAAVRALIQPLIDLGLGGSDPLTASPVQLATAMRTAAPTLASVDPSLPNLLFSTAQVFETANDRIRTLVALNAPAPASPPAPEA
ncbi:hypothetical protein [Brevundimonas faecalis]|uniref:Uncharacterized protein n=1 Tax=Brevundimonas faecalis TaxID=947378 RepID=A0ABV2RAS6_9CAUL